MPIQPLRRGATSLALLAPLLGASTGCATPGSLAARPALPALHPAQRGSYEDYTIPRSGRRGWYAGEVRLQGYLAVTELTDVARQGDDGVDALRTDDDVTMPTIGGGAQWKLAGDRLDIGLEGLLSLSGQGNLQAFAIGSGGAAIAVDIDLAVVDFYGGPFASVWLGNRVRCYGAAGPLVMFASYEEDLPVEPYNSRGTGFGAGWYGRLGIELLVGGGTSIGVGARYSDANVDLDSRLGDLELEGIQYMFTVTSGW